MATAVEPNSAPSTPGRSPGLPLASLLGAVYVGAALAILVFLLPVMWTEHVTPALNSRALDYLLLIAAEVVAFAVLAWFGNALAGGNPPRGMHGGIFLMISVAVAIFFVARAFALNIDGPPARSSPASWPSASSSSRRGSSPAKPGRGG